VVMKDARAVQLVTTVPVHCGHRRNVLLIDNKSNHESDIDNERHENLKVSLCILHTGPGETDIAQYRTGD
jgi:hypothetical protein